MPRFQKGQGGRPKGAKNKAPLLAKALAQKIVEDPKYQAKLLEQAQKGRLHPSIQVHLWERYAGKVKNEVAFEDKTPRPLVIDRVSTRAQLLEALGAQDVDAGTDAEDDEMDDAEAAGAP